MQRCSRCSDAVKNDAAINANDKQTFPRLLNSTSHSLWSYIISNIYRISTISFYISSIQKYFPLEHGPVHRLKPKWDMMESKGNKVKSDTFKYASLLSKSKQIILGSGTCQLTAENEKHQIKDKHLFEKDVGSCAWISPFLKTRMTNKGEPNSDQRLKWEE